MQQRAVQSKPLSVEELNAIFTPLPFKERIARLYQYFEKKEVLFTSSFGTKSVFLLHLVSQTESGQKVHFIDTTYHFKETLKYKRKVSKLLNLDVIDVLPREAENKITQDDQWWIEHPKMCCSINKIVPLEPIVERHKVWISGLMAKQTKFRSYLRVFEQQGDILKFHPLVDIDEGEMLYHKSYYKLPSHPLEKHGYGSIGCRHCTVKGEGRSGRWKGKNKTECGLHPSYFNKKT